MFEVDDYGYANWMKPKLLEPHELLEWITIIIQSLQNRFPEIGHAVIRRSGQGFHVVFPKTKLSKEQFNMLLNLVPHDVGWRYWTDIHGRATLRISVKPIVKVAADETSRQLGTKTDKTKPQTIRILYPNGKILYTHEIQRRYGNV